MPVAHSIESRHPSPASKASLGSFRHPIHNSSNVAVNYHEGTRTAALKDLSAPSRFDVLYAPAAKKQRKQWKEASLTVNEGRAVLFDTTLKKTVGACGTPGAPNAIFKEMSEKPQKSFSEGDEFIFNGAWSVQIIAVMHRHLCPYDEPLVAAANAGRCDEDVVVSSPPPTALHTTVEQRDRHHCAALSLPLYAQPPMAFAIAGTQPTPSRMFFTGRRPLRSNKDLLDLLLLP
jgi:hypothetical protein